MIRWLEQVGADDVGLVGGKGASLGEMVRAGLPVPPGFCVTVQAYRAAVDPLHEQVLSLLAAGEHDRLRQVVAQVPLPPGLEGQVASAVKRLGGPLAVRSSATAEDLPQASFAGQQETVLGVVGTQDVLAALRRCWASLWSDRAIAYRYEQGFAHQEVALAVVVQRMVPADAAGVAFTADPVTGQRAAVVIESSWGLGESVVSGAVTPDSFVVSTRDRSRAQGGVPRREHGGHRGRNLPWARGRDRWVRAGEWWRLAGPGRSGAVLSRRLGDKRSRTDLAPAGATRTRGTTVRERRRFSLTSAQARQVAALARRVEAYQRCPVDIEWAVAGGRLWLLQARPITTLGATGSAGSAASSWLGRDGSSPDGDVPCSLRDQTSLPPARHPGRLSRFLRADIMEHFPAPYPLDVTALGIAWRSLQAAAAVAGVRIHGSFPGGAPASVDDDGVVRLGYPQVTLWGLPLGVLRIASTRWPDPGLWARREGTCAREAAARMRALPGEKMTNEALGEALAGVVSEAEAMERARFTGYLGAHLLRGAWLDVLLRLARTRYTQLDLLGDLDYATVVIDRGLSRLAASAPEPVRRLLAQETVDDAVGATVDVEAVRQACPRWWREVEAFLAEHGTRTTAMYQPFSSTSWSEDLPAFLSVLAMRVGSGSQQLAALPAARLGPGGGQGAPSGSQEGSGSGQAVAHARLVAQVGDRLPRPLRKGFTRLVTSYRAGHVMREASVVEFEQLGAAARGLALEAGRRLREAGLVEDAWQVVYLRMEELEAWLHGEDVDIERLVRARVRARPRAEAVWQQQRTESGSHQGEVLEGAGAALVGVAASPGTATGTARVVTGPADFARLRPGDVLVCQTTDPAWTPLFARAVAVVAESGGRLSHAAIVAREYAIPAVLGVAGATTRIADGAHVTVDGTSGRVVRAGEPG